MILSLLRRKKTNEEAVIRQYEAITAAARNPVLYTDMGAPDTVMGRFEMITLHLVLYLRRMRSLGAGGHGLAQEVLEAFFQDMDHSIRELGIGDLGVPKRMKKFAKMFYGRLKSYGEAIDARDNAALAQALARNIHPEADVQPDMAELAAYMMRAEDALGSLDQAVLASGQMVFPAPEKG